MNIQIFGTKKSSDTRKAERFFKERGIKFQSVDLKEKGLSKGEFSAVIPPGALTACEGEPNCVSFVAYNASGAVVARNYSLVSKVSPATVLLLR